MKHNVLFYALILMVGTMLWMGCSGKTGTEEGMAKAEEAAHEEITCQCRNRYWGKSRRLTMPIRNRY